MISVASPSPSPFLFIPIKGDVLLPGQSITLRGISTLPKTIRQDIERGVLSVAVVPSMAEGVEGPQTKLFGFGVEARLEGKVRLPDGDDGYSVRGVARLKIVSTKKRGRHLFGLATRLVEATTAKPKDLDALMRAVQNAALTVARLSPSISAAAHDDFTIKLGALNDPIKVADVVAAAAGLKADVRLKLVAAHDPAVRLKILLDAALREHEILKLSDEMRTRAERRLADVDRKTLLQEQLRAMKKELGDEGEPNEIERLYEELDRLDLPPPVREAVERELDRMELMPAGSAEYMVSYTYVTWIRDLPWGKPDNGPLPPLATTRAVLDRDHFGLADVKERVLEYLAVMRHGGRTRGEILLLVGPPGVGKTSLSRSIAASLGRPFVQISLGGVKDEAEIRGHRRTYIGSMPGKLVHALKDAKTRAPVILLDEIDKIGLDQGRSVTSSALLEVLDFEQNKAFVDHYLGVPIDLSEVIFICTANTAQALPKPLLDRLEVIELPSYTEAEKVAVAARHLVPKIRKDLKLKARDFAPSAKTLAAVVRSYTREAGVRQLQRDLSTIARKLVKAQVEGKKAEKVEPETLAKLLGPPRFQEEPNDAVLIPGVAIGLAYTSVGGDILYIETMRTSAGVGRHRLSLTGSLGKVMRESIQAALAWLTAFAETRPELIGFDVAKIDSSHIHVHFPDGATPKDGPSAGLAVMCAIVSLLAGRPLPARMAMTGEITLRGQVLPIGGLKEKLLAAHRYGKKIVLIPAANHADLATVPKEVLKDLEIIEVRTMEEALRRADLIGAATIPARRLRPVGKSRDTLRIASAGGANAKGRSP